MYAKKLHSSDDSRLEASTTRRGPDYYDTNRNPVCLGSPEVIHMTEPETQDHQEKVIEAFCTKVKKSLYIDLAIWNKLGAKSPIEGWHKVDTGASDSVMSMEVFKKLFPGQKPKPTSSMFDVFGNTNIAAECKCTYTSTT